jgi:hypothetical protein
LPDGGGVALEEGEVVDESDESPTRLLFRAFDWDSFILSVNGDDEAFGSLSGFDSPVS